MGAEATNGNGNGSIERAVGAWVFRSLHFLVSAGAAALLWWLNSTMQTKISALQREVASKDEVRELQGQVRELHGKVSGLDYGKRIDDHESRVRVLENRERLRFPPRRPGE